MHLAAVLVTSLRTVTAFYCFDFGKLAKYLCYTAIEPRLTICLSVDYCTYTSRQVMEEEEDMNDSSISLFSQSSFMWWTETPHCSLYDFFSFSLALYIPEQSSDYHYALTPGSEGEEHVAFNWTLFILFPVLLIESNPSVGQRCRRCSVAMIKEHDEASTVPLDGHVTVVAAGTAVA